MLMLKYRWLLHILNTLILGYSASSTRERTPDDVSDTWTCEKPKLQVSCQSSSNFCSDRLWRPIDNRGSSEFTFTVYEAFLSWNPRFPEWKQGHFAEGFRLENWTQFWVGRWPSSSICYLRWLCTWVRSRKTHSPISSTTALGTSPSSKKLTGNPWVRELIQKTREQ